jgi:hypothetical protein
MANTGRTAAQVAADKFRTGRPPKKQEEKRTYRVTVNLTAAEYQRAHDEARQRAVPLADVVMGPWRRRQA